jgi:hypothetical protein
MHDRLYRFISGRRRSEIGALYNRDTLSPGRSRLAVSRVPRVRLCGRSVSLIERIVLQKLPNGHQPPEMSSVSIKKAGFLNQNFLLGV